MAERATRPARSALPIGRATRRLSARRLILAAAGLLIVILVAVLLLARPAVRPRAALAAPAFQAGTVPCRQDPMAHVHDPTRLVLVGRCSTVSGTVRHVHYEPRYGDQLLLVAVDLSYQRFLPSGNEGLLMVDVIPTDETSVRIPRVGQHASFHGAFVFNKNRRAVELYPAWRIDAVASGGSGKPRTEPRGSFSVTAHAPPAVAVGGPVAVSVHTARMRQGQRRPASKAHLFLEVIAASGKAVQWAAASTNSLGDATIHLVVLQAPGQFTLTLYANDLKLGRQVITKLSLKVRRR
jgi:hypothetical protein